MESKNLQQKAPASQLSISNKGITDNNRLSAISNLYCKVMTTDIEAY